MNNKFRIAFIFGLLILLLDAALPLVMDLRQDALEAAVAASHATEDRLTLLLSAYKDAETGQRGFMLTGRPEYLEPYRQGRQTIAMLLPQLTREFAGDARLEADYRALLELERREAAYQQASIQLRAQIASADGVDPEQGKAIMDAIRGRIRGMRERVELRGDGQRQAAQSMAVWSEGSLVAVTALDLLLFGVTYWFAVRATRAQQEAMRQAGVANQQLQQEVARRIETQTLLEKQAGRLRDIVTTQATLVASELDTEQFLAQVVQRMLELTPATGAVVEMVDGDEMLYRAASGSVSPYIGLRLPRSGSLSGLCVEQRILLLSPDTTQDPRVDGAACRKVGAASMVVTPLFRAGEVLGVLKVLSSSPHAFDEGDIQVLQLIAGQLGSALGHQLQFERNQTLLLERGEALKALERELNRREKSEAALVKQQQTLREITDSIPAYVAYIDLQERFRYCNPQYAALYGAKVDHLIGTPLGSFLAKPDYDSIKPYVERALAGHSSVFERTMHTPDGQLHVESHFIAQSSADGQPTGFYCVSWDITERKQQELQWQSRAQIDALTGLFNRAAFTEALELALLQHQAAGEAAALLYLDVDRFKQINDTHGHAVGDEVLRHFSHCIKKAVRETDLVGRLGGDEFCILLDRVKTPETAQAIADKILEVVRQPVQVAGVELRLSTSIGIAFAPHPAPNAEQLIPLADGALYQAKQAGRGRHALEVIAV
jgi:diguanylate cyclase (GGDEF)-like protein/PAS domain S-box-containing protein